MENIVGIIKAPPRKKNQPTKYWKQLVGLWFGLYAEFLPKDQFGNPAKPSFDTVEGKQYKIILKDLRKRCEDVKIEWDELNALKWTEVFLRRAWEDKFVSSNFMLRIISNNRSKIFNNQITPKNGSVTNIGNNVKRSTPTSDSKIKALEGWGLSANKNNDGR